MKTKHPLVAKVASLLSLGWIFAAGAAGAQTVTQTYNNSNPFGTRLPDIGFDSYGQHYVTGYDLTGPTATVEGPNPFGTNWGAINYIFNDPGAPAGYALTGVDLTLFILDVGPNATTTTFDIYAGLDRTGGVIGHFDLTDPTSDNAFSTISIPLSALAGGFSLGYAAYGAQPGFVTYTESHTDAAFHPQVTFTYSVIPEPSAALIGTLGLLPLLRRRRG